ncbi:hypothetical protein N7474_010851 [Penicillium riverlandense]|uniref:uncharacterized protein n=1 Tax=Penicillium riverlandense TaxID=1903569 RepID=UPI002547596C|nr:uncharacterized protein N7474_010851 [Penicillium riverlandense]KAJ5804964.1 hypothetical protein N7474_010851 [Penicillium riverlandense]
MDVTALRDRIQSTLDANAEIRQQAELDLKYAETQPGFINALLDILQGEQNNAIQLSAGVYLKNRITRGWSPAENTSHYQSRIPAEEKPGFRERLIPALASAPANVRNQLVPLLQKILQHDFPGEWPGFLDLTLQLLGTHEANTVYAGLQCLLAVCRTYRFKAGEKRDEFDKIVEHSFPQLLSIGSKLVDEESLEAAEMLRIVVKSYKHAIYFELSPALQTHQATVDWCTLFLRIVAKTPPANGMGDSKEERELNHWWKCKKWSYANLNRLFVRYGNPTTMTKSSTPDYTQYAKTFISTFAPEILKGYLQEIDKWVSNTQWLSTPALSYTLAFMEECVKPKAMWDHLKPHMDNLIAHFVFPILCQSDEDIEMFEDDPSEYLHRKLNYYEEVSAPDLAATNFLVTLTKNRKKQTFAILTFVNGIVSKYESAPDDQKLPREKEGALRMIGSLASVILGKKSPIADQVEYFFVRHVFPEFRSPHGFLRARACDTLEKFEQLDFKDPNNLMVIYRNILESMTDSELPVRVEAALALQPLIRHDIIRTSMQQNIPQIMQQLLKLANEVDVDALANVMEDFVEVFSAELTPFAVALSEQLRDTYMRIVGELLEKNSNKNGEEDTYGDFLDDKSITALGVLQTIGTLILTLESTPDVLLHLETVLMPVISITLENKLYDLYNEVFEIIDSCTFASKSISPTMWQAFELIHKTFKAGAELYLEDMLPALDNFIAYGSEMLVQNPAYLNAVVSMVEDIFTDEKVGGVDRICGCKLAETLMLNLRGHIDQYIHIFITLAMRVIDSGEARTKSYRIHLMEMVINAIYYNPVLSLQILEANGLTNKFFSAWFSNIDNFRRVHDKKLSIAAISSLLTLPADSVPESVQQGWPRLLQGVTRLFQTLPAALKQREDATRESDFTLEDDDEDDEDNDWDGEVEWNEDEAEEAVDGDVADESAAYLEFLNQEAAKFGSFADDDDDDLDEESLLETPLDKVEPYGMFKHVLLNLQQEQPQLYENLTKVLGPEEQQVIQAVFHEADAKAMAAAANAEAAAAAGMQSNGNQ